MKRIKTITLIGTFLKQIPHDTQYRNLTIWTIDKTRTQADERVAGFLVLPVTSLVHMLLPSAFQGPIPVTVNSSDSVKLADAQHLIAAEYGIESYPKLKRHVRDAQTDYYSRACTWR